MLEDYEILAELLDSIEQLQRRTRLIRETRHSSLVGRLKNDLEEYANDAKSKKLQGRSRKRRSGELFRRIIRLYPFIWKSS